jgi:hypothetical protein
LAKFVTNENNRQAAALVQAYRHNWPLPGTFPSEMAGKNLPARLLVASNAVTCQG